MDYNMPGINGVEAAHKIQQITQHPRIVIVSGEYLDEKGTADEFMLKPVWAPKIRELF